jgi:hypothetical protein
LEAKSALGVLQRVTTLAHLAENFDLHSNQVLRWREQYLAIFLDVFAAEGGRPRSRRSI